MSKPIDKGLHYFNVDCGIFSDKSKLKPLLLRYHGDGLALYMHILCDVYDSGYYFKPDNYEDYLYALAQSCVMSVEKVQLILAFMADRSLLDANCLNKNTVFTSHGIQKRYCQAMKGRKRSVAEIKGDYWILSKQDEAEITAFYARRQNYDKSEIKADKSEIKADKSESYDTKKRKENKRRNKREDAPALADIAAYCKSRNNRVDPQRFFDYYTANGWTIGGQPVRDWQALVRRWETNGASNRARSDEREVSEHEKATAAQLESLIIRVEDDTTHQEE